MLTRQGVLRPKNRNRKMDTKLLEEVIACLRGERTLFRYYRDAYAAYLLQRVIADQEAVALRELRQSRWASLLNRPLIRELIANCGNGYLQQKQLREIWVEQAEPFVLTVGNWGEAEDYRWDQISRPGSNLVLQLNLCNHWQKQFEALVHEPANDYIGYGHPVSETRKMTLAWARLDFDFNTNEVLVEEVQTDLVRIIGRMQKDARAALARNSDHFHYWGARILAHEFNLFAEQFFKEFKNTWHEAMLAATVKFVFEELGIEHLFYHSFETGCALKNIEYRKPPRSIYTELPEKFCFEETQDAPKFLQENRYVRRKLKKLKDCRWFLMAA